MNHDPLNIEGCKDYGIAFGEAVLFFQTPPSRSQIRVAVARYRPTESGFGGWADEKIKNSLPLSAAIHLIVGLYSFQGSIGPIISFLETSVLLNG